MSRTSKRLIAIEWEMYTISREESQFIDMVKTKGGYTRIKIKKHLVQSTILSK